jgi:hypothetical protein
MRGNMPERPTGRAGRGINTPRAASVALFLLVLVSVGLAGCSSPSFDELSSDLDALAIPDGWRLADTLTNGPGGDIECVPPITSPDCPQVIRYYVATGSPEDVYRQGEEMLVDAGFVVDSPRADPCDLPAGLPLCYTLAAADGKRIALKVEAPDHDFGDFGDIRIEDRSGPIVSISAWRARGDE